MRVRKLPFPNSFVIPEGFQSRKTSELISKGPFFDFKNPGLMSVYPVGNLILERIRIAIDRMHSSTGAFKVQIPGYMKREILEGGEDITDTFAEKFVILPEPMQDYMALTTHEMEVLDWLGSDNLSHNAFPLKIYFNKHFIRPIKYPRRILKLREFEVYAMISLDLCPTGFSKSLNSYSDACKSLFSALRIPFVEKRNNSGVRNTPHKGFDLEYFYITPEGERVENLQDTTQNALSLAMGYRYFPRKEFIRKVHLENNQKVVPVIGSYAIGLERVLYSTFDSCRDSQGFNLPEEIRPFDYAVVVLDDSPDSEKRANEIYNELQKNNKRVLLDNRKNKNWRVKVRLTDYLGIPKRITVSKSDVRESYRGSN